MQLPVEPIPSSSFDAPPATHEARDDRLALVTIPVGIAVTAAITAGALLARLPFQDTLAWTTGGLLIVLTSVELLRGRDRPSRSNAPRDLICSALSMLTGGAAMTGVGSAAIALAGEGPGLAAGLPFALAAVAALLVSDAIGYWAHRAYHVFPSLWRMHAIHHLPSELYVLMSGVEGPLIVLINRIPRYAALVLLGFSDEVLFVHAMVDLWQGLSTHIGFPTRNPWVSAVLHTPETHRYHHSRKPGDAGNYAFIFTLWDRMLGTWIAPSGRRPRPGIADPSGLPSRWWQHLLLLPGNPGRAASSAAGRGGPRSR
jgi:sterol desaturase/sphingolipid hydroxylase (fatty acid hydroxylase superfamily)